MKEDFKRDKIKNICRVFSGATPSTNNALYWHGDILWITPNDLSKLRTPYFSDTERKITQEGLDNCSTHLMPKGTLVMSSRAPIGYLAIAEKDFTTNQGCKSFAFYENYDSLYFYYCLQNQIDKLKVLGEGTTFAELSKSYIEEFEISFPNSKLEQSAIAEIMKTVDESIEQTENLIAKYQRIQTGLMQDLLTRGIDAKGNIRSKAIHKFVVKNGIEVPEDWDVKKLNNCIDKSTIITYGIVQTGLNVEDGVRVLRTIDLQKDRIDSDNLLRTSQEISNSYKRTVLKKFDIVCNVRASVGDFNIIEQDDLVGCNTTRGVARISPHKEINPYYLLWFLRSERNTRQMEFLIKGTTFIDINIADLREILIPIPSDKKEQDLIAGRLNEIKKSIESLKNNLNKFHSLKIGLMQDLLSGEVRVTS